MGGSSKKQTVGYKYYLGMHMILGHGVFDKVTQFLVDGKVAAEGTFTGGRVTISADNLFGGESREGGVSGELDLEMGRSDQGRNDYLQSQLGSEIPAYRGVVGVVLRKMYLGINPYLKRWSFIAQRIHTRSNGETQWYDSRAEISRQSFGDVNYISFAIDRSGSMAGTRMDTVKTAMGELLDALQVYVELGYVIHLQIIAWSEGYSEFRQMNLTTATVASAKTFVNNIVTGGGTVFHPPMYIASSFFPPYTPGNNHLFLITDGTPSEPSQFPEAVLAASLMLDRGAVPYSDAAGTAVNMYGINVDLTNTTYTAQLDNTSDAIPVLSGSNPSELRDYVLDKLLPSHEEADMNPAHIIRECLTDTEWGMGYNDSDIDDVSFMAAADRLFIEGMGMSLLWDTQTPIQDFLQEVVKHINASLYVDRKTGKFTLKLIRSDYDVEDLLVLGEGDVYKVENASRPAFGELVNSVTVNYWDRATRNTASVTVGDPALMQMQGADINTTSQYPGFTNSNIASRVALRNLKALSTPLLSCTVYASRKASALNVGDVFVLNWPDLQINNMVVRVQGMALGDAGNNRVKLTVIEDVFDTPKDAITVTPDPVWEDPNTVPGASQTRLLVEAPYYELVQRLGQSQADSLLASNPDASYFLAAAARPSGTINANMLVDAGAGYVDGGVLEFSPVATLSSDIGPLDTAVPYSSGTDMDIVRVGSHVQIGQEVVRVDAIATSTLTVGRGVLDTVPTTHVAGTTIFCWDDYADGDDVEYVSGETVSVKVQPVSGAGPADVEGLPVDTVTFQGRAYRPYPPGNFKVNGAYFPQTIGGSSPLNLSWSHRDRLQQTAGSLQDFTAGNIGPESGVTYTLRIYGENGILLRYEPSVSAVSYVYDVLTELTDQGSSASVDPYWDSVVSLLHLNANFTDEKGKSWSSGSAVTSTTQYKFGERSAGTFSSTVYKQAAASSDWAFGTGDFTIEFWAYATSMPTTYYFSPIGNWQSGNGGWSAWLQPNGVVSFTHGHASPSGTITLNTWNLWSISKIDGVLYLHINGILVSQLADTNNFTQTGGPRIGGNYTSTDYWRGYVDEVRITKGVGRYGGSNYAVPVAEFPNVGSTNRLNGKLTVELGSTRDAYSSLQKQMHLVRRRGYGFNYGEYYG